MADLDPYGTDVRFSELGDLVVSPTGDLTSITGAENCAQALALRLRTFPGELPLQLAYGSQLAARLVGQKANDPDLARSIANVELRELLRQDRRFLAARDISATDLTPSGDRLAISLTLRLAGGEDLEISSLTDVRVDELVATIDPAAIDPELDVPIDEFAFLADNEDLDEMPELDDFIDASGLPNPEDEDAV